MQNDSTCEPIGRRDLLRSTALAAVGVAALTAATQERASAQIPSSIPGTGNTQILNFLLFLADLQAEMYAQAVLKLGAGGIPDANAASTVTNPIVGLQLTTTSARDLAFSTEWAQAEKDYASYLRNIVIGTANAITVQKYDFGFSGANATRVQVLTTIIQVSQTVAQSYLGAVALYSNTNFLEQTFSIQGTEARHATAMSMILNELNGNTNIPLAPCIGISGPTPSATAIPLSEANLGNATYGTDLPMDPNLAVTFLLSFVQGGSITA